MSQHWPVSCPARAPRSNATRASRVIIRIQETSGHRRVLPPAQPLSPWGRTGPGCRQWEPDLRPSPQAGPDPAEEESPPAPAAPRPVRDPMPLTCEPHRGGGNPGPAHLRAAPGGAGRGRATRVSGEGERALGAAGPPAAAGAPAPPLRPGPGAAGTTTRHHPGVSSTTAGHTSARRRLPERSQWRDAPARSRVIAPWRARGGGELPGVEPPPGGRGLYKGPGELSRGEGKWVRVFLPLCEGRGKSSVVSSGGFRARHP